MHTMPSCDTSFSIQYKHLLLMCKLLMTEIIIATWRDVAARWQAKKRQLLYCLLPMMVSTRKPMSMIHFVKIEELSQQRDYPRLLSRLLHSIKCAKNSSLCLHQQKSTRSLGTQLFRKLSTNTHNLNQLYSLLFTTFLALLFAPVFVVSVFFFCTRFISVIFSPPTFS